MADIQPAPAGTWQAWLQNNLPFGTRQTSGYRSPSSNAAAGGSPTSYHMTGTPSQPGAIDIGGPAAQLTALFNQIKQQFAGRIEELYLNIPGGQSQDIRNNQTINSNPEAGNPQHLHVAIGGTVGPGPYPIDPRTGRVIDPTVGVPFTPGAPHYAASGPGEEAQAEGSGNCKSLPFALPGAQTICWSDVWMYGAGLALVLVGGLMVSRGESK